MSDASPRGRIDGTLKQAFHQSSGHEHDDQKCRGGDDKMTQRVERMSQSLIRPFVLLAIVLGGCASTTFETSGDSPRAPICEAQATALVLWGPAWRANQKDAPQREAAAQQGIESFFAHSGCYRQVTVQRVSNSPSRSAALMDFKSTGHDAERVVIIAVRELGPIVNIFSSQALVDGGTEVVLTISRLNTGPGVTEVSFDAHWRNGGPLVVKGVSTLPNDMEAALSASFRPK